MERILTPRRDFILMAGAGLLAGCTAGSSALVASSKRETSLLATAPPSSACHINPDGTVTCGGGGPTPPPLPDPYNYTASNGYKSTTWRHANLGKVYDSHGTYLYQTTAAASSNGGPPVITVTTPSGQSASMQMLDPAQVPFDTDYVWNGATFHFNSSTRVSTATHTSSQVQYTSSFDSNGNVLVQDSQGNRNLIPAAVVAPYNPTDPNTCLNAILTAILIFLIVLAILIAAVLLVCRVSPPSCETAWIVAGIVMAVLMCYLADFVAAACGTPPPC